jgi:hypothetical protein
MLISYYQRHVFHGPPTGVGHCDLFLMCYHVLCLESISHLFQILQPMHFHGWLICDRRHLFKLMIFYFISVLVMSWLLCSFVTCVLVLLFALYFFFWWMGSPFLPFKNKNKNNIIYIYIYIYMYTMFFFLSSNHQVHYWEQFHPYSAFGPTQICLTFKIIYHFTVSQAPPHKPDLGSRP